jgi:hypothetical protein
VEVEKVIRETIGFSADGVDSWNFLGRKKAP